MVASPLPELRHSLCLSSSKALVSRLREEPPEANRAKERAGCSAVRGGDRQNLRQSFLNLSKSAETTETKERTKDRPSHNNEKWISLPWGCDVTCSFLFCNREADFLVPPLRCFLSTTIVWKL